LHLLALRSVKVETRSFFVNHAAFHYQHDVLQRSNVRQRIQTCVDPEFVEVAEVRWSEMNLDFED